MRWRNHKIVAGLAIYSITGGFLSAGVAAVGAILPDVLELGGLLKHRSITHWPYPYLAVAALVYLWQWRNPSIIPYLLYFFILGVVTHLLLDGLSKSGIPVGSSPSADRRIALDIYKTFTPSEEITAAGLMLIFLAAAYSRGFLGGEHIQLEVRMISGLVAELAGR